MEQKEELISQKETDQLFFDVRTNRPQKDQVMARYSAVAYLVESHEKRNLLDLITKTRKVEAAVQVARRIFCATDVTAIDLIKNMLEDLHISKMSYSDVLKKEHRYILEQFYYTKQENIPDDPHWECISIMDTLTLADGSKIKFKSTISEDVKQS